MAKELATKTQATVVPFSTLEKVDGAYLEDGHLYFRGELVMAADESVFQEATMWKCPCDYAVAKLRGVDNQPSKKLFQSLEVSNTVSNL